MDDEKLIALVRANPHLYNKNLRDYRLVHKKQKTWESIAQEMDYSEQNCMRRWTSLRDRYVKERRLEKLGKKPENGFFWPLLQSMDFIAPYVIPRSFKGYQKLSNEKESTPPPKEMKKPDKQQKDKQPLLPINVGPIKLSSSYSLEPNSLALEPEITLSSKRKRNLNDDEVSDTNKKFAEAVEAFKKICKSREEKEAENDPIYNFEQMIISTIGSLNPMKQAKAMSQVTDVVMRIKMESESGLNVINYEFITHQ